VTSSEPGDPTPLPDGSSADGPYGPPPPQNPYAQSASPAAPPPYGQPQPPYGQAQPATGPAYGAPEQASYGAPQQPGYGYGTPVRPNHPSATTALVLGLIGLAGIMFCGGLTLVLSPFAWRIGATAVREIDASPGAYGGRDQANAGKIMGIIGTALLALGIVLLLVLIVFVTGTAVSTSP
jgi:hypothetical protein